MQVRCEISPGLGLCCGSDGTAINELVNGLVKSPLECPAGAEQLLDPIAVVGWPRELEVLSWELPCSAVTAAAAVPSVVLVLINVLN